MDKYLIGLMTDFVEDQYKEIDDFKEQKAEHGNTSYAYNWGRSNKSEHSVAMVNIWIDYLKRQS